MNRSSLLIHGLVALINGLISLTLLLIAPLGLAAVITLTALLMLSSFLGGITGERVLHWLKPAQINRRPAMQRTERSQRHLPDSREG